jgi:hypothetical protein
MKVRGFGTAPLNFAPEKSKPGFCTDQSQGAVGTPRECPTRGRLRRQTHAPCTRTGVLSPRARAPRTFLPLWQRQACAPHLHLEALQHEPLLVGLLRRHVQLVARERAPPRLALLGVEVPPWMARRRTCRVPCARTWAAAPQQRTSSSFASVTCSSPSSARGHAMQFACARAAHVSRTRWRAEGPALTQCPEALGHLDAPRQVRLCTSRYQASARHVPHPACMP